MGLTATFSHQFAAKLKEQPLWIQADLSHKISFDLKDVFSLNLHAHGQVILEHSTDFPWIEYIDNLAISIPLL